MEEKTIDRIIKYLKINEKAAVSQMVADFGVSKQVVHRKLKDLLVKGFIRKEGSPPKVVYFINKEIDRSISIAKVKKSILPVLKKHGIKRAAIFGSLARGEQNRNSDIDLLIDSPSGTSLFDLAGIKIDLEAVIGCGRKVDLLEYGGINPLLKKDIFRDQKKIYG